jgi:hypothetical protein
MTWRFKVMTAAGALAMFVALALASGADSWGWW